MQILASELPQLLTSAARRATFSRRSPRKSVVPYARNARKIPAQAVDKVAASLREFGWRQPIVVDRDRVIICGHTRLLAAQKLGLTEAPVHVAENLTPAQVRAYRLLDNRSHEESAWDPDLLSFEFLDLREALNKKEKEILSLRDQITRKEKELLEV